MNVALGERWTTERFLQWEDGQEGRYEFDGAKVVEVSGSSRAHQVIVFNLARLLTDLLDPARFDAVHQMRLQVGQRLRYPDVSVVAGTIPGKARILRDAVVLFEVLSDDTAATDRGEKRDDYARLPGIRCYVLLEQDRMAATLLERTADGWAETPAAGEMRLPELDVVLPFSAIYRNVRF